jgi:16S rRNA (cytosine967-C5)-methyltransferase
VTADPARLAAYDALQRIETSDAYLNLVLPGLLGERRLDGRDAAFATELAYGTSRFAGSYDAVLEVCVRAGTAGLQRTVRTVLRLGCHQLLRMRVPRHAAVSTTVELARTVAGERPVRLVNAVLRKVTDRSFDDWMRAVAPSYDTDPVGHLAVVHSHPRWIVDAYRDALPDLAEVGALLDANNTPAPVTLAARPGLADRSSLAMYPGRPGRWSPYAWQLSEGDPGRLPPVRNGLAGVQDEGSQVAALVLAAAAPSAATVPAAGTRWLDLCAGPGGKAALLTGIAGQRGARVVAAERRPHRAALVVAATRAYATGPAVVIADGTRPPWRSGSFGAVLVDAPCTGLGALRRRPEARWRRSAADLTELGELQRKLLDAALESCAVGGVVAYVTCSPLRAETRDIVDAVRKSRSDARRPGTRVEDARHWVAELAGGAPEDYGTAPYVQLWPHVHGSDAMFIALLRRC